LRRFSPPTQIRAMSTSDPIDTLGSPYLHTQFRKRQLLPVDDEMNSRPLSFRSKRRKLSSLEHGFAHLSLHSPVTVNQFISSIPVQRLDPNPQATTQSLNRNSPPSIHDVTAESALRSCLAVQPSVIEEPMAPEINMCTWYEPEKDSE